MLAVSDVATCTYLTSDSLSSAAGGWLQVLAWACAWFGTQVTMCQVLHRGDSCTAPAPPTA
jgi:hypothetical protein